MILHNHGFSFDIRFDRQSSNKQNLVGLYLMLLITENRIDDYREAKCSLANLEDEHIRFVLEVEKCRTDRSRLCLALVNFFIHICKKS